jgi:manganese/iron transport system permease protein/iron/zinc/copper transport system permease protein
VSALVGAVLAGAVCGLVGVFVVLRSMSFAGHGLTHAVFGGAAIAEATGAAYLLGAGLWGGLAAVAIWAITRHRAVTADAAIGVVTVASFAIGVLVQSRAGGTEHGLEALLFGEADRVRGGDVVLVAVVAVIVMLTVIILRRPLTFSSFDPDVARVHGLRVGAIDLVLMLCVAATVVATARIIGTLLATSLLVLPALAARLSVGSVDRMLVVSVVVGVACSAIGVIVGDWLDVPPGASVTIVATVAFGVAFGRADVARRSAAANADQHPAGL